MACLALHKHRVVHRIAVVHIIAMGDEALPAKGLFEELHKGAHLIDKGLPCFMALLHGRDDDALNALRFDNAALGVFAIDEGDIFGGGNNEMDLPFPGFRVAVFAVDLQQAVGTRSHRYGAVVEIPDAISDAQLVAFFHAQHAYGMIGVVRRQSR